MTRWIRWWPTLLSAAFLGAAFATGYAVDKRFDPGARSSLAFLDVDWRESGDAVDRERCDRLIEALRAVKELGEPPRVVALDVWLTRSDARSCSGRQVCEAMDAIAFGPEAIASDNTQVVLAYLLDIGDARTAPWFDRSTGDYVVPGAPAPERWLPAPCPNASSWDLSHVHPAFVNLFRRDDGAALVVDRVRFDDDPDHRMGSLAATSYRLAADGVQGLREWLGADDARRRPRRNSMVEYADLGRELRPGSALPEGLTALVIGSRQSTMDVHLVQSGSHVDHAGADMVLVSYVAQMRAPVRTGVSAAVGAALAMLVLVQRRVRGRLPWLIAAAVVAAVAAAHSLWHPAPDVGRTLVVGVIAAATALAGWLNARFGSVDLTGLVDPLSDARRALAMLGQDYVLQMDGIVASVNADRHGDALGMSRKLAEGLVLSVLERAQVHPPSKPGLGALLEAARPLALGPSAHDHLEVIRRLGNHGAHWYSARPPQDAHAALLSLLVAVDEVLAWHRAWSHRQRAEGGAAGETHSTEPEV